MGKTRTLKYRIVMRLNDRSMLTLGYEQKPNYASLKQFIDQFHESMKKGNCNAHLSEKIMLRVNSAKVIEQKTDKVVCEYIAPLFEAI